jgi:hypothetical protein
MSQGSFKQFYIHIVPCRRHHLFEDIFEMGLLVGLLFWF